MLNAPGLVVGRFPKIAPVLAAAGPAAKRVVPPSPGTFPSYKGLLVGLLVGVMLILGGLTFSPAFILGPAAGNLTTPAATMS